MDFEDHNTANVYGEIGLVFMEMNRFESAIRNFENSLAIDKTNAIIFRNMAKAHFRCGNESEARKAATQAVQFYNHQRFAAKKDKHLRELRAMGLIK